MSARFAVSIEVALSLLRHHLKGFKGYPRDEEGENVFARCLQDCCISVAHVEAVLNSFDLDFPTKRDIVTTATNLRQKFEVQASPHKQWAEEFGMPERFGIPSDAESMHWRAIRDALYYTEGPANGADPKQVSFWESAARQDAKNYPKAVATISDQIRRYGWVKIMAMKESPEPIVQIGKQRQSSHRGLFAAIRDVRPAVTQADIDKAEAARPRIEAATAVLDAEPEDEGEESNGWDDPER